MTEVERKVAPAALERVLRTHLPQAGLALQAPPQTPEIRLWLLSDLFPRQALDPETVNALMEAPPYWTFCWGSGQVLARYLLDHADLVRGRVVLDIGPGSGVVAIAAALAGAARVLACDLDAHALQAVQANAAINAVEVECYGDLDACLSQAELVTAADILYDRDNLPLLQTLRRAPQVLLADSRIRNLSAPGYVRFDQAEATTWPDLAESSEFIQVRLYRSAVEP